jgi:hypothetical protein
MLPSWFRLSNIEGVTFMPHFRLNNKYDGSTIMLASSSYSCVLPLAAPFCLRLRIGSGYGERSASLMYSLRDV